MRLLILTLLTLSACGVTPNPDVQPTGSKKTTEKNAATTVAACTVENCQAVKLTVVARPLESGVLKGYLGQPVNWQFSLDSNGVAVTRGVGVFLLGPPQSWPGGIPNQLGNGTFSVMIRDIERCKTAEKDASVCTNVQKDLPNYDGKGVFNYQILPATGVAAAPVCPTSTGPSVGSIIGGIAGLLNPLAFIPVMIVNGIINSSSKTPGC